MPKAKPLISICIPTYNRADILDITLASIVEDKTFLNTNKIEIVISDNCSTDSTPEICKKYTDEYPDKIFYHKTEENIGGDKNFIRVLSLGRGELLKLNNDTCSFLPNGITKLTEFVEKNKTPNNILFFSNGMKKVSKADSFTCKDINEFVSKVGHRATWISTFAIWRNDFESFENISRCIQLQLFQLDVILRSIKQGKQVIVNNQVLCEIVRANNKGGYNPAVVFGTNYLMTILSEYLDNGLLQKKIFEKEKKKILIDTILPYYIDIESVYSFERNGLFKTLLPIYKNNYYFYINYCLLILKKFRFKLFKPIINKQKLFYIKYKILLFKIIKNNDKLEKYKRKLELENKYREGK